MKAAQEDWTEEEQCKKHREGNDVKEQTNLKQSWLPAVSGNSKEVYNPLKALVKTQQHKSAVTEDISWIILTECTAFLNRWTENTAVPYKTTNTIMTLAYSRVTRPPSNRLKAYLCWGKRLKRLCVVWKQENIWEWTTSPLSCWRMEARQQQRSWQRYARRSGRRRNCRRSGHNRSSYLYQWKETSSNVWTILPSV